MCPTALWALRSSGACRLVGRSCPRAARVRARRARTSGAWCWRWIGGRSCRGPRPRSWWSAASSTFEGGGASRPRRRHRLGGDRARDRRRLPRHAWWRSTAPAPPRARAREPRTELARRPRRAAPRRPPRRRCRAVRPGRLESPYVSLRVRLAPARDQAVRALRGRRRRPRLGARRRRGARRPRAGRPPRPRVRRQPGSRGSRPGGPSATRESCAPRTCRHATGASKRTVRSSHGRGQAPDVVGVGTRRGVPAIRGSSGRLSSVFATSTAAWGRA